MPTTQAAEAAGLISPGTMAALTALSTLAQAGGAGYAAYAGAEEGKKDRKFKERQWLQSLQDNAAARSTDNMRYGDSQAMAKRNEAAQRPLNSVGLLSGLSSLQQGLGRANPIDVLGYLAR